MFNASTIQKWSVTEKCLSDRMAHSSCSMSSDAPARRYQGHLVRYRGPCCVNMEPYTWPEMSDMVFVYGAAAGNSREAQRRYQEQFPLRRQPHHTTFAGIFRRLRETGSFTTHRLNAGRGRTVRTPEFEEEVLQRFAEEPSTSTRSVGQHMRADHTAIWRVLHDNQLHPYHPQKVQAMGPQDFPERVAFARWYLNRCVAQPIFPAVVLFTDEACFTREGMFNSRNSHVWDQENPHATIQHAYQQRFSVNVWAGIVNDFLIGPYLLPQRLNSRVYRVFLEETLPELLEDVPLAVRKNMWFQHDGAPAHFANAARNYLNATFRERWIGRGGPVPWPPRSPDLTPLDFFLWGHVKSLVYETPVDTEEELIARIIVACDRVRHTPGIFERVRQSIARRCRLCNEVGGRHFEQLL